MCVKNCAKAGTGKCVCELTIPCTNDHCHSEGADRVPRAREEGTVKTPRKVVLSLLLKEGVLPGGGWW